MKSFNANLENAVPHVLYDVSLPLEERRAKALHFKCLKDVGNFLGKPYNQLYPLRKPGIRIKGKDGKEYALRIKKISQELKK